MIYSALYSTLTLTYPCLGCTFLAGLSRQIRNESQPLFYESVHFNFTTTAHCIDYLTNIGTHNVRKLRHVSLQGHLLQFSEDGVFEYSKYDYISLPTVFSIFPGLQLSTLTVWNTCHGPTNTHHSDCVLIMMENIRYLIEGDGFQELTYLSTGVHLGLVNGILHRTPWDNRARWECLVKARDGPDSGAKVDIFPVTKSSACKIENGTETIRACQECDGHEKNYELDEIEIRVKRGKGANYVHPGWCMSNGDDSEVREVFQDMNWNEINKQGLTVVDRAMECWQQILHERVSHGIPEEGLAAPP